MSVETLLGPKFDGFIESKRKAGDGAWRLGPINTGGPKRNRPENLSRQASGLYPVISPHFNGRALIDARAGKITYPYPKSPEIDFDSRLICYAYSHILALNHGLLLHATAVERNGQAYLFCGPSGAGKSTVAYLSWQYRVLGDDVVAVRKAKRGYHVFPTPWWQKSVVDFDSGHPVRIRAIFFIEKSGRRWLKPVGKDEAFSAFLVSCIHYFTYMKRPLVDKAFSTALGLIKSVPVYKMGFSRNGDFWPLLDKELNID